MKKLLPLIIMAVIASCGPSRYLPCPKDVTMHGRLHPSGAPSINWDDGSQRFSDKLIGLTHLGYRQVGHSDTFKIIRKAPDTIPEWMHVSMRPKAYVVAQMALSVRVDGICTQHLDCAGKPFPVHYTVGWCQGKEELFNRLVKEGRAK